MKVDIIHIGIQSNSEGHRAFANIPDMETVHAPYRKTYEEAYADAKLMKETASEMLTERDIRHFVARADTDRPN